MPSCRVVLPALGLLLAASSPSAQPAFGEEAKLLASQPTALDHFGIAVAAEGTRLVAGAVEDSGAGLTSGPGTAYVFVAGPGGPVLEDEFTPPPSAGNTWFGGSVAVDGDVVVVGARGDDTLGEDAGAAWLYEQRGADWVRVAHLVPSRAAAGDAYGQAVAVRGDTVLVGARASDDGVAVFERAGASWLEQDPLVPSTGGDFAAEFGAALALADDLAIVGAPGFDGLGYDSGAVYSFHRDGAGWAEDARLEASDGGTVTVFGRAVAFDGSHLLVGADTGSAYLFARQGDGWGPEQQLTWDGSTSTWSFGRAVALADGRAVVGASEDAAAVVFSPGDDGWTVQRLLVPSDGTTGFASALAMAGDALIAGAPGDGDGGSQAGAAYLFDVPAWGTWSDLAHALAGGAGEPRLAGTGSLLAGDPMTLSLEQAAPDSLAAVFIGFTILGAPLLGGVLVPAPDVLEFVPTDAQGGFSGSVPWPALPPGTTVAFHVWISDAAAPFGWSASNAVSATTP